MNIEDLKMMLGIHAVDYSKWGIEGCSEPLEALLAELERKETTLMFQDKQIIREVLVVYVTITYGGLLLVEDRTEWKDGRPHCRPVLGSVAEIRRREENAWLTAKRGIQGGLGLTISPSRFTLAYGGKRSTPSISFPGLMDHFAEIHFSLTLREGEFKPKGYKAEGEEKTSYFVWKNPE